MSDTEGTTPAPTSATPRPARATVCPTWCQDGDHANDPLRGLDEPGEGLHKGPRFGERLRVWGCTYSDGRPMSLDVVDERRADDMGADELRALAYAARQAAGWLEEHSTVGGAGA